MNLNGYGMQSVGAPRRNCHTDVAVPILRSGVLARKFCRSVALANVEAVFERSFYLRAGDEFMCVGESDIGNGPLTLIGSIGSLSELELRRGQTACVGDELITIGNVVQFALNDSEPWRPAPWPVCPSPAQLIETSAILASRAARDAPQEGLARPIFGAHETLAYPLARVACGQIAIFRCWLSSVLDSKRVVAKASASAIQGLIGLGPGLTPSGDDFLLGALALLDAIGERQAHAALARMITEALPGLTAPLSACFLRAAAAGHIGEDLHHAVSSVIAGNADSAISAVGRVGHSSGWDMLAGIATTLHVVATARLESSTTGHAFALS